MRGRREAPEPEEEERRDHDAFEDAGNCLSGEDPDGREVERGLRHRSEDRLPVVELEVRRTGSVDPTPSRLWVSIGAGARIRSSTAEGALRR